MKPLKTEVISIKPDDIRIICPICESIINELNKLNDKTYCPHCFTWLEDGRN